MIINEEALHELSDLYKMLDEYSKIFAEHDSDEFEMGEKTGDIEIAALPQQLMKEIDKVILSFVQKRFDSELASLQASPSYQEYKSKQVKTGKPLNRVDASGSIKKPVLAKNEFKFGSATNFLRTKIYQALMTHTETEYMRMIYERASNGDFYEYGWEIKVDSFWHGVNGEKGYPAYLSDIIDKKSGGRMEGVFGWGEEEIDKMMDLVIGIYRTVMNVMATDSDRKFHKR